MHVRSKLLSDGSASAADSGRSVHPGRLSPGVIFGRALAEARLFIATTRSGGK